MRKPEIYEFARSQSIYHTTNPVESTSLAIWGIEGVKIPETKTNHYLSIRRLNMLEMYAGLDQ